MQCKLSSSFPFLFHYQNNIQLSTHKLPDGQQHPYGWMCKHRYVQWSLVRTYSNTPPQFANVWLLFLFILLISHSHDYYIPILSCTFHTTFIQTCMGAEETYGALTLCLGAYVVTPEIGDTSVVVSTWEFFFKSELIMSGFLKKRYIMPNAMLIHHPPFSCTICPIGRTSIGVRGYTKNPKECKYKCQKEYSFIRNITCQHIYSISVFFFQPTITGKRVYHSYISSAITLTFSMQCERHCFHRIQNLSSSVGTASDS